MTRPELKMKFRVAADLREIARIRSRLQSFLENAETGLDARARMEVTLALDEAATNIVLHGYNGSGGVIDVEYEVEDGILIRLWDDGVTRDASDCVGLPPGIAGEGGMGTNIMRASFTELNYDCVDGRNVLRMHRRVDHTAWTGPDKGA